jgi:hypothetical protein
MQYQVPGQLYQGKVAQNAAFEEAFKPPPNFIFARDIQAAPLLLSVRAAPLLHPCWFSAAPLLVLNNRTVKE